MGIVEIYNNIIAAIFWHTVESLFWSWLGPGVSDLVSEGNNYIYTKFSKELKL